MQGFVEQDAGVVTRERSTRAIRAVHAGRQTYDKPTRIRIAESGDRCGVITRKLPT
jgi:hypothetical protein